MAKRNQYAAWPKPQPSRRTYNTRSGSEILGVVSLAMLGTLTFIGISLRIENSVRFTADHAKIEILREDVVKVGSSSNEDVIGQITQWNQTIKAMQAYNQNILTDLFYPDSWNDVKLIDIPQ